MQFESIANWCVQPEEFFNELKFQGAEKARLLAMRQQRNKSDVKEPAEVSEPRSVFSLAHSAYQIRRSRESAQVAMNYWFVSQQQVVSKFHAINYNPQRKCERMDFLSPSTSLAPYSDMIAGRITTEQELSDLKTLNY